VYSWTLGDIDAAIARAESELHAIGLPNLPATVVDLGAGFGLHALPLARRGFKVFAIDSCEALLQELRTQEGSAAIRTIHADLLSFGSHILEPVDAILCMGDTLTHLADTAAVESLFAGFRVTLSKGGLFVATFRDYVTNPLQADGRFLLVRSDANRILTCFLEYAEASVRVHDVLHERIAETWQMRVSSYTKLRLAPSWVGEKLASMGFSVRIDPVQGGMLRVIARSR
jgi:2-polyprenyl-3-methyl-5-hydroxy-6-metoxy-1,4-benzoquinol methylase